MKLGSSWGVLLAGGGAIFVATEVRPPGEQGANYPANPRWWLRRASNAASGAASPLLGRNKRERVATRDRALVQPVNEEHRERRVEDDTAGELPRAF